MLSVVRNMQWRGRFISHINARDGMHSRGAMRPLHGVRPVTAPCSQRRTLDITCQEGLSDHLNGTSHIIILSGRSAAMNDEQPVRRPTYEVPYPTYALLVNKLLREIIPFGVDVPVTPDGGLPSDLRGASRAFGRVKKGWAPRVARCGCCAVERGSR